MRFSLIRCFQFKQSSPFFRVNRTGKTLFFLLFPSFIFAQTIPAGYPMLEEYFRRAQLLGENQTSFSNNLRPIDLPRPVWDKFWEGSTFSDSLIKASAKTDHVELIPIRQTIAFNTKRPYGWGNGPMLPNVGIQTYTSVGVSLKLSILRIQLAPEFVYLQNRPFQGFSGQFSEAVNRARFFYWRFGDYPERFGTESNTIPWWGQSKITLQAGFLEAGLSTENIHWGPGQYSSLTFSNNARSFPHFTIRSRRPANTFLGSFEGEILVGRLEDSGLFPSQIPELNNRLSNRFNGDYKYLNALTLTYQPKWLPGFFLGISRTHQQYSRQQGNSFGDYLPIFEPFQKTIYGFDRDSEGRDQQATFFGRWVNSKRHAELYFEYGRRDHAYNWREAILNPEHARAYLLGLQKLWQTGRSQRFVLLKSEVLHQQESINRLVRYLGTGGGYTWHTHGQARGFANYGEALGTGPGVGSNVQTLELSLVERINKKGILLERLANHQDFFYRAFGRNSEKRPWIDYSLGLIWDQQFDSFIIGSKLQFVKSQNYQWESGAFTSEDFDNGPRSVALYGQVHLIYNFQNK